LAAQIGQRALVPHSTGIIILADGSAILIFYEITMLGLTNISLYPMAWNYKQRQLYNLGIQKIGNLSLRRGIDAHPIPLKISPGRVGDRHTARKGMGGSR
jgi:hypothetical protein